MEPWLSWEWGLHCNSPQLALYLHTDMYTFFCQWRFFALSWVARAGEVLSLNRALTVLLGQVRACRGRRGLCSTPLEGTSWNSKQRWLSTAESLAHGLLYVCDNAHTGDKTSRLKVDSNGILSYLKYCAVETNWERDSKRNLVYIE